MNYTLITTEEGFPMLIVNNNLMFAWNPNDLENYGVFVEKLEQKGIEEFVRLMILDHNTAFLLFCQP